jgi:glycosyltransferase involved in cell wall biosynthesis
MKINIYTSFNGVGLEKDYLILKGIFEAAGHTVGVADWKRPHERPSKADVAIHLEIPRCGMKQHDLMLLAPVNYLMPNPEWFDRSWLANIKRFKAVLCKTQDCLRIFSQHHNNCIYTGFTALDFYDADISKSKQLLHVQGASEFKGTAEILQAWSAADLPRLFMLSKKQHTAVKNVVFEKFLPDDIFRKLLNSCLIHLCPSYYEGFGHYIWEAMSCGCVALTTDAAPMNEFISDGRCLVGVKKTGQHHLGLLSYASPDAITDRVRELSALSFSELVEIGDANRKKFLENDKQFRENIMKIL